MTQKELSNLYHLNREIDRLQDELDRLDRRKKTEVLADTVKGSSKYFPYTERSFKVSGLSVQALKYGYDDEIEELKQMLECNIKNSLLERLKLEQYIQSIDDAEVRQIMALRYINGLSWKQVACHISPYATEDSVRKIHARYLEKEKR